jgi:hypothetical protein
MGAGGVDEGDAKVEGTADDVRGLALVRAAGHAQAAMAAAPQAGDADMGVGAAEPPGLRGFGSLSLGPRSRRNLPTARAPGASP